MFDNEISQAIQLLEDDNLVWSSDFDGIRTHLAGLLKRALQNEYHYLEPEIGDLAIKLIRERELNAGESNTDKTAVTMCCKNNFGKAGQDGQCDSCCRPF